MRGKVYRSNRKSLPDVGRFLAVFLLVAVVFPPPAAAYLDPLSGSILIQVVAGGVLAGSLTLKRFWRRVRDLMHGAWAWLGGGR
jgi:hypothetical protein